MSNPLHWQRYLSAAAALGWHKARVHQASVVQRGIPSATPPPAAPCEIVAIPAVGVSGFAGRTIDALAVGDPGDRSRHRGRRCGYDRRCGQKNNRFHMDFLNQWVSSTELDTSQRDFIPVGKPAHNIV